MESPSSWSISRSATRAAPDTHSINTRDVYIQLQTSDSRRKTQFIPLVLYRHAMPCSSPRSVNPTLLGPNYKHETHNDWRPSGSPSGGSNGSSKRIGYRHSAPAPRDPISVIDAGCQLPPPHPPSLLPYISLPQFLPRARSVYTLVCVKTTVAKPQTLGSPVRKKRKRIPLSGPLPLNTNLLLIALTRAPPPTPVSYPRL